MITIADAAGMMAQIAPLELAEDWDNVGLLLGDPNAELHRLMTCLTVTPDVVAEAERRQAEMIVAHHPLPFRPLKKLTTLTTEGGMLWRLAKAGVSLYSAHTAFDSTRVGINEQLAATLGLGGAIPFATAESDPTCGVGRIGDAEQAGATLGDLAQRAKQALDLEFLRVVGDDAQEAMRIAVACGSGGSLFDQAIEAGAQAILTGEASFHDCLKARSLGVGLVLVGHYASERFAMEALARQLDELLPSVEVWCSDSESDPLRCCNL